MKRHTALSVALATVLATAVSCAAAAPACVSALGVSIANGDLREDSQYGTVSEDAAWRGVLARLAVSPAERWCVAIDAAAQGGDGSYDGYTQSGAYHATDTQHRQDGATLSLHRALGTAFDVEATLGIERFDREIAAAGTVSAIEERYRWSWAGIGGAWQACGDCRVRATVHARYEQLLAGDSHVDLGFYGSAVIDLGAGTRRAVDLSLAMPGASRWIPVVTIAWTQRDFAASGSYPVKGSTFTVRQPEFLVRDLGLQVAWPLR